MAKVLIEFRGATPSREALRMAISSGNPELIWLI
jgi:hypothetical protein